MLSGLSENTWDHIKRHQGIDKNIKFKRVFHNFKSNIIFIESDFLDINPYCGCLIY